MNDKTNRSRPAMNDKTNGKLPAMNDKMNVKRPAMNDKTNRKRPALFFRLLLPAILFLGLHQPAVFAEEPLLTGGLSTPYEVMNPERFSRLTSRQVNDELLKLEAAYPDLISHTVIGRSVNGRDIFRMRLALREPNDIGNPGQVAPVATLTHSAIEQSWLQREKPAILMEAGLHARETANPYIAYRILANYARDVLWEDTLAFLDMRTLLTACSIDFVMLSNPDGYDLVKFGKTPFTLPKILSFLNSLNPERFRVFKSNVQGVDLNRNFSSVYFNTTTGKWVDLWGKRQNGAPATRGWISTKPSAMFHAGSTPASEPETKALSTLVSSSDYRLVISLHSMGNVVYWDRPYLSSAYNADARPYALEAGSITHYSVTPTSLADNYSGYFGDFFANETQKTCLTVETTKASLPTPWQAYMEAYNRVATLPYRMAEMAVDAGYARYRLFRPDATYVRDIRDKAYAEALAKRDGLTVWDSAGQPIAYRAGNGVQ